MNSFYNFQSCIPTHIIPNLKVPPKIALVTSKNELFNVQLLWSSMWVHELRL